MTELTTTTRKSELARMVRQLERAGIQATTTREDKRRRGRRINLYGLRVDRADLDRAASILANSDISLR